MTAVRCLDCGLVDYLECWELQREIFEGVIRRKTGTDGSGDVICSREQTLILCEHPHVYTVGRNGNAGNMLVSNEFLQKIGARCHRIDRGGDITYHGPGQLVAYPILDLDTLGMGVRSYIHALEQTVIDTLRDLGIAAGRREGAAGVWLGGEVVRTPERASERDGEAEVAGRREEAAGTPGPETAAAAQMPGRPSAMVAAPRKICAIGVRASRGVTMHGLALNVATELEYFSHINPCGFPSGAVTSVEQELGRKMEMVQVKTLYRKHFEMVFGATLQDWKK